MALAHCIYQHHADLFLTNVPCNFEYESLLGGKLPKAAAQIKLYNVRTTVQHVLLISVTPTILVYPRD